jgi:hypothetical protein
MLSNRRDAMVRFSIAALCVNCDTISEALHDDCPKCGSKSLLNLARILNDVSGSSQGVRTVRESSNVARMEPVRRVLGFSAAGSWK